MDFSEYKEKQKKYLQETITLFSNVNKKERELWVVRKFLNILGIEFTDEELISITDDPPDVIFHKAKFEIMEIMDNKRKRHIEFKERFKKLESAKNYSDVMEGWDKNGISLKEVLDVINNRLKTKKNSYSPEVKIDTDLLIYLNLKSSILSEDLSFTIPEKAFVKEWRSVSMVLNNNIGYVFNALKNAPEFIKSVVGKKLKLTQSDF